MPWVLIPPGGQYRWDNKELSSTRVAAGRIVCSGRSGTVCPYLHRRNAFPAQTDCCTLVRDAASISHSNSGLGRWTPSDLEGSRPGILDHVLFPVTK